MSSIGRAVQTLAMTVAATALAAGPALAHTCVNASKNVEAGVQVVFSGPELEIVWATQGVQQRITNGVIDPETGAGFHGLVGFDLDGDGIADVSTWQGVGPDGQIPTVAQAAGPECRGMVDAETFLTACT